jgi:hypothetical protein
MKACRGPGKAVVVTEEDASLCQLRTGVPGKEPDVAAPHIANPDVIIHIRTLKC